ncbi:hypothetical protein MJO28_013876 [Puccinia striiformis f. sp. tritici]|uniref:Uncharacterized protein n=1 Tax=Puccinia striiformis f. sp. tritici TaxID=168172 RepID=A0ACC0DW02_9BASI|nr:hypothetical protein MJO28_013876 [Puccinia striiformis f. sp. tritici]
MTLNSATPDLRASSLSLAIACYCYGHLDCTSIPIPFPSPSRYQFALTTKEQPIDGAIHRSHNCIPFP